MMLATLVGTIVLTPVADATAAVLLIALVLAVIVSFKIKRVEARLRPARAPIAVPLPVRPAPSSGPVDVQDRLRRLSLAADPAQESYAVSRRAGSGTREETQASVAQQAARSEAPRPVSSDEILRLAAQTAAAHDDGYEDRTRVFGTQDHDDATPFLDAGTDDAGATHFFGAADDAEGGASGDATAFFGGDRDAGATAFFGAADDHDGTTFFGAADGHDGDHTAFFGPDEDGSTRFFGAGDGLQEDHTAFFGVDSVQADNTAFFRASDDRDGTAFFGTGPFQGHDRHARPVVAAGEGATSFFDGGEHALPASVDGQHRDGDPLLVTSTEGQDALEHIRRRLAALAQPDVLAVSVVDGRGHVLAGETDEDLAAELRSLIAESGQGTAADVEQPVRLEDDSEGAILLMPTGSGVLLGALVREGDDSHAVRASLRGLAGEIGDTMRCAS